MHQKCFISFCFNAFPPDIITPLGNILIFSAHFCRQVTIDGVELTGQPISYVQNGTWNKVPIVLGSNLNEYSFFLCRLFNATMFSYSSKSFQGSIKCLDCYNYLFSLFESNPNLFQVNSVSKVLIFSGYSSSLSSFSLSVSFSIFCFIYIV